MPSTASSRSSRSSRARGAGGNAGDWRKREAQLANAAKMRQFSLHYGQTLAWQAREQGYRIIALMAGSGGGKALALDTPIPTPGGWTTMGALAIGDTVFDERGQPCRVLDATPIMTGHVCYDVVFSDGTSITADADHLWETWDYSARKAARRRVAAPNPDWAASRPQSAPRAGPRVVTTQTLKDTLRIRRGTTGATALNHAIPLAQPLALPERALPIDPYTLGVWLGDGTGARAEITVMDTSILERIAAAGYAVDLVDDARSGQAATYRIGALERMRDPLTGRMAPNGGLESLLRSLGLLNNKHVPDAYLRASVAQREALLMGLMDTDGTIGTDGGCCFDNTNQRLADAVYELAAGLGLKPTRQERDVRAQTGATAHCYRVAFTPHRPVFHLPRKRERQRLDAVRQTQYWRYVLEVRERPSVPVRCITVDSPSHLYLASRACIPTHNTWYGARHFYPILRNGLDKTYLWTEPTWRMLKRVMLPTIVPFLDAFDMGELRLGDMMYELRGGGRILFGSVDNPNSLQGAHIDGGVWADEVGLYTEEAWDVLMQRSALYKAHILATSTPYTLPWLEQRLAKPAKDPRTANVYRLIQFPSYWNPAYPLDEFFRLKRAWPEDKFRRLMEGEFTRIGGLVYDEFQESRNLATIYLLPQRSEDGQPLIWFKHPEHAPQGETRVLTRTWMGQDWGWSPDPGVQLLLGQDAYGRMYVLDEDYETQVPVVRGTQEGADTWINRALKRVRRCNADTIYCDPAYPADIENMRAFGLNAVKAINNLEYGFDQVNQCFRMLGGELGAGLYIAQNTCPNLVRTLPTYVRQRATNSESYLPKPAPNQDDHALDALRYAIVGDTKPADQGAGGLPPALYGMRRPSIVDRPTRRR